MRYGAQGLSTLTGTRTIMGGENPRKNPSSNEFRNLPTYPARRVRKTWPSRTKPQPTPKPTTSNRSTRKGSRGYGRAPRVKPSQIIPATVAKHHRLMLTVTCLAYPLPVDYTRLQSASRRQQSNSGIPCEFPAKKPKRKPQNTEGQHSKKSSRSDGF